MATTKSPPDTSGASGLDLYFRVSERGSTVGGEIRAGLTTFLAMAYILIVNPQILSNAITVDNSAAKLVTITALAAAFGCLVMGLWANLPFALAPGLGLNAYFAFAVVLGLGIPWQTALGAVFISGILFLIIAVTGARKWILDGIPIHLKHAITAGIGAFLAIIGFTNAGFTVDSPATLITGGDWTQWGPWLALGGLILMGALLALKVRGALLIGILAVTVVSIISGVDVYLGAEGFVPFPGFGDALVGFTSPTGILGQLDIAGAFELGIMSVVFTFLFVDFFDTAGTLIGLSEKAGMLTEDGQIEAPMPAFATDGLATSVGAVLGTSSTTTYIESAAGVEDGGRTGLTSLTVGILFLVGMFFSPLVTAIPSVATAPALIVIGAMMMTGAAKIDWSDYRKSIPAFLAIVGMPFTYSITLGISLGILTHTILMAVSGKAKEIHPVMWILTVLIVLNQAGFIDSWFG